MKITRIHTHKDVFLLNGYQKIRTDILKIEAYYNEQLPDGGRVCSTTDDYRVAYGPPEGFIIHYEDKIKIIPYCVVTLIEGIPYE